MFVLIHSLEAQPVTLPVTERMGQTKEGANPTLGGASGPLGLDELQSKDSPQKRLKRQLRVSRGRLAAMIEAAGDGDPPQDAIERYRRERGQGPAGRMLQEFGGNL